MKNEQKILARRYAQAYNTVYGSQIPLEVVEKLPILADTLEKDRYLLVYARLKNIKEQSTQQMLELFKLAGGTSTHIRPLIDLVVADNRLTLLPLILRIFSSIYLEEHGIIHVTIESAVELSGLELEELVTFFAQSTDKKIRHTFIINPALIAGIRMYSESLGFEDSVRQRLSQLVRDSSTIA